MLTCTIFPGSGLFHQSPNLILLHSSSWLIPKVTLSQPLPFRHSVLADCMEGVELVWEGSMGRQFLHLLSHLAYN